MYSTRFHLAKGDNEDAKGNQYWFLYTEEFLVDLPYVHMELKKKQKIALLTCFCPQHYDSGICNHGSPTYGLGFRIAGLMH